MSELEKQIAHTIASRNEEIERLRGLFEKIANISAKIESKEMDEIWLVATEGLNSIFDSAALQPKEGEG